MIRSAAVKLMGEPLSQSWPTWRSSPPFSFHFDRKLPQHETGMAEAEGSWGSRKQCVLCIVVSSFPFTNENVWPLPIHPHSLPPNLTVLWSLPGSTAPNSLLFTFPESWFLAWYHRINIFALPGSFLWIKYYILEMSPRAVTWWTWEVCLDRALASAVLHGTFHVPVSPPCHVYETEKQVTL